MQPASKTEWWQHRRLLFPLAAIAFLSVTLLVALARSNISTVTVCNKTGAVIRNLEISACGQSRRFESVFDRESVQLHLDSTGSSGDIILSAGDDVLWRGEYVEAGNGYHALLQLHRDNHVDSHVTLSLWRSLLQPIFETRF